MHLSISTYMYEAKLTSTLLLVTAFKDTACSERSGAFNKTINKCETDGGGWEETTCDAMKNGTARWSDDDQAAT